MGTQAVLETASRVSSYEADKEAAREIQYSLVPSGNLISAGVEVAFRFSPFAEVGGDFTDFFQLPNGLVGLYLGDVVGKGLAAAMYAALVMGTIRGINKTGEDTAAVLTLLNKRLLVRPIIGTLLRHVVRALRSHHAATHVFQCGPAAPGSRFQRKIFAPRRRRPSIGGLSRVVVRQVHGTTGARRFRALRH